VGIPLTQRRVQVTNPNIWKEKLPCDLNQAQIHARGVEIAKRIGDRDDIEIEKKANADRLNADIKIETERIWVLAREVRERREYRDVDVKQVRVENTGMIQWFRLDTDELLRERPMSEDERQLRLLPEAEDEPEGLQMGEPVGAAE
jgi:hypothetical protein